MNALGVYLLTSLLFVFGTMIEFAFILLTKRIEDENCTKPGKEKEKAAKLGAPFTQVSPLDEGNGNTTKETEDGEKYETGMKLISIIKFLPSASKLDFVAFITFFLAYAVFNLVYWMYYMFSYN